MRRARLPTLRPRAAALQLAAYGARRLRATRMSAEHRRPFSPPAPAPDRTRSRTAQQSYDDITAGARRIKLLPHTGRWKLRYAETNKMSQTLSVRTAQDPSCQCQ